MNQQFKLLFIIVICFSPTTWGFRRHPSFFNQEDSIHHDELSSFSMETQQHFVETAQRSSIIKSNNNHDHSLQNQNERNLKSNQSLSKPIDHLITDLPYLPNGLFPTKHWAGHIPASKDDDKKLFYWLFEPDFSDGVVGDDNDEDVPLLIWLNGGPGCSSMVRTERYYICLDWVFGQNPSSRNYFETHQIIWFYTQTCLCRMGYF